MTSTYAVEAAADDHGWDSVEVRTVLGREFLRVSRDKSHEARSNSDQHVDNVEVWTEDPKTRISGLVFGEPYEHVGSASDFSTSIQKALNDLLADLKHDRFGARYLILWEVSRLSRQIEGGVDLVKWCKIRNVLVAVTDDHKVYDPRDHDDYHTLIEKLTEASKESARISRRTKRTRKIQKRNGDPHGEAPFGYYRTWTDGVDARGRTVAKPVWHPHPIESGHVEELFRRYLAGDGLTTIARDWDRRGVRSRSGRVYRPTELRDMLARSVYAGLRSAYPKIVGKWEAIVDPVDFYLVQDKLAAGSRAAPRTTPHSVLCTTSVRCGETLPSGEVCGAGLRRQKYRRARRHEGKNDHFYQCQRGHVSIDQDDLDSYVGNVVIRYIADPANADKWTPPADRTDEVAELRATKADARAQLAELDRQVKERIKAGKPVNLDRIEMMEQEYNAVLEKAEARERELSTPAAITKLLGDEFRTGSLADVEDRWAKASMRVRREVLKIVLTKGHLGMAYLMHSPTKRRPGTAAERLKIANGPDDQPRTPVAA